MHKKISKSSWYKVIVYFLQNLQCPPELDKSKSRDLKLKAIKYCIINQFIFWKDPAGILLNYVNEDEAKRIMTEMHKGACGGHHYWKSTTYKILKARYYFPELFSDVFAK